MHSGTKRGPDRPLPLRRTSGGATSTTSSSTSGTKLKTKSFCVLEWKRSVVETMIDAEQGQGDDVEHRLGDERSRAGPGRSRACGPSAVPATSARAGSPSRAGRVADISTPIIVAEVTSRRRTGRCGSAARAIQYQEAARKNSESAIRAQATRTQLEVGADDVFDDVVEADLLRRKRGQPDAEHTGDTEADPAGDLARRLPVRTGAGSSDGSRRGGLAGKPSAGRKPSPVCGALERPPLVQASQPPARRPRSPDRRLGGQA